MRNLKKVLAVIVTVALLASMMMVPALAAVSYEPEALKLQAIGLFAGGPADLKLEDGVTRVQGLTFAIRAAGKEKEALAMSDADVATELAKFTDSATIPTWAKKYVAYAVKNGITVGVGNGKLAPLDNISGTSFLVFVLKSGMGYSDVTTANVIDKAVAAKVITAGQAVAFGGKAALIRDDAAAILFGAAKNGVNADGKTFIESLIAAGFVDQKTAYDNGFGVAPAAPKLEVESVKATNLKEVVVTFNNEINEDNTDELDFDVDGTTPTAIDVDGKVVTLTMPTGVLENDEETTLTVDGAEDVDENVLEDCDVDFTPSDSALPELESVEFTGPQTAKLAFSEPINPAVDGDVSVDDGIYNATVIGYSGNKVEVDLGTELDEGSHSFKVTGFSDYVPYKMIAKTMNVTYTAVDTAPVVTIKEASQTKVTLSFNRPVKGIELNTFYHTYSSWKPLSIVDENGDDVVASEYYDEITLKFTDNSDATTDRPLPEGKVKLVVLSETDDYAIEDRWENNLDDDVVLYADISADTTAPAIKKITVADDQKTVKVYFTEEVSATTAKDADNVTITDPDGDEIESYDYTRDLVEDGDDYYLEIVFDEVRDEGTYKITLDGIKDVSLAENEIEKVTKDFAISDTIGVDLTDVDVTYVGNDTLYVDYGTAMATTGSYSVLDAANYQLEGADIDEDDVTISMFTSKIVKIVFDEDQDFGVDNTLTIARVADADGNLSSQIASDRPITEEAGPVITAVKKVDDNKLEITVNKELKSVNVAGIQTDGGTTPDGVFANVGSISFVNDGDDTVIKVTLKANEDSDGTGALQAGFKVKVVGNYIKGVTGAYMAAHEYVYGVDLNGADSGNGWKDGTAPELAEIAANEYGADTDAYEGEYKVYVSHVTGNLIDEITLVYSEDIDADSVSKYTYKVGGYSVDSVNVAGNVVTLAISNDDDDVTNDLDATPTVTQAYDIEDYPAGNSFLAEDSVEAIEYAEWAAMAND